MSPRADYERHRPHKTSSVRKECGATVSISDVRFRCAGVHGPRSRHWSLILDDQNRTVWLEWSGS